LGLLVEIKCTGAVDSTCARSSFRLTTHQMITPIHRTQQTELSSLVAAAKVAAAQASRLQLMDQEVTRLQSMLALIKKQVGDRASAGGAMIEIEQLAALISPKGSAPAAPTSSPASGGGLMSAPAPAAGAPRPAPGGKQSAWGRSTLPQNDGLWNASPSHPASAAAAASKAGKGPGRHAGVAGSTSARSLGVRNPFTTPERVLRPGTGSFADGSHARASSIKMAATVHAKLTPDAVQQLNALYK